MNSKRSMVEAQPAPRASRMPLFIAEAIVAILVLGLIAFAGLTAYSTREKALADESDHLARQSFTLAEYAHTVIFGADLVASSLEEYVGSVGVRSPAQFGPRFAGREMHERLKERIVASSEVDALALFDAKGDYVSSSRSWPAPVINIADRDYFTALRDNPTAGFALSDVLTNRVTGQESMILSRRISAADGAFLGAVVATIGTGRFARIFTAAQPGEQGFVSLHRRDGGFLSGQPQSGGVARSSEDIQRSLRDALAQADQARLRADIEGGAQMVAVQAVRAYPLAISVINAESAVLAEWRQLANLIFAFAAAAILLILLLGLAVFRSLTMQVQLSAGAQQLAIANQDLSTANHDLESFSYSIAHDLRAPLRVIRGLSNVALEDNREKLDRETTSNLDGIVASATRMGLIVDDLLRLSRITRQEIVRQEFDFSELAQGVAAVLAQSNAARTVRWVVHPALRANADAGLVRVCLENLLGNAWKFTGHRADAEVTVGAEFEGVEASYFVRDNGAGFDMQHAKRLFMPFQRLHHDSEFEGTGIGLSIVHRIISRHGGRIWAESEPGKGTVFRFTLGEGDRLSAG